MRTLRRPLATAAAVAAAALTLGACSDTNFSAQTNQPYQPGIGANYRGDVDVLNTLLVANPDGTATVSAGVVNQSEDEDTIVEVAATTLGGDPLTVEGPDADVDLTSKAGLALGREGGDAVFVVSDAPIGQYVRLTISFGSAADATIEAPVVTRGEIYEDVALQ